MSRVILRGTISVAPKIRIFEDSQSKVANFSVQTTTMEPDGEGNERERIAFCRVKTWGRNAERVEPLVQGDPIYVEGRLQTHSYKDQQGREVEVTAVLADIVRAVESAEPQVNRSILLGNVGSQNELQKFDWGVVVNLSVATNEWWITRSGEEKEETEWHRVSAYQTLAQEIDGKIDKGQRIFVIGYVQTREYTGRDGKDRRSIQTVAQTILGSGKGADPSPEISRSQNENRKVKMREDQVRGNEARRVETDSRPETTFRDQVREGGQETSGIDTSSDGDDVPF